MPRRRCTSVDDLKGKKVRVQATKTEDTHFPAYGAQPVHMPFGEVYTSLQTGVVDMAENGVNVYLSNKHYEVAPVMSFTQHEANNNLLWVSDKTWQSLSDEQKAWVEEAAAEVGKQEPPHALELEQQSAEKLKGIGVKIVEGVDKSGFVDGSAADSGSARRGAGPECGRDRRDRPRHQIASAVPTPDASVVMPGPRVGPEDDSGHPGFRIAGQNPAMTDGRRAGGVGRAPRLAHRLRRRGARAMTERPRIVLQRDRHLKWRAFDALEALLMVLCGVAIAGFSLSVALDIVTRTLGHPLALAAGGDLGVLHLRQLLRPRGGDAARRPPDALGDH